MLSAQAWGSAKILSQLEEGQREVFRAFAWDTSAHVVNPGETHSSRGRAGSLPGSAGHTMGLGLDITAAPSPHRLIQQMHVQAIKKNSRDMAPV